MSSEIARKWNEGCDGPTPVDAFGTPEPDKAAGGHRPWTPGDDGESAVVITGADGTVRFLSMNYESLCGYSRYEVLGRSVRDLRSSRRDSAFFRAVEMALRCRRPWSGTLSAVRPDGSLRLEAVTICPVTDASGTVHQCVGIRRHATRSDLHAEAIGRSRVMEAVARLAGGMAHHYNNLLTSIIGHSDMLLVRLRRDAVAMRSVEQIREAGERAAVLTRQFLAFSQEQALMPKTLDLNGRVAVLGRELRARWGNVIDIRTVLADDLGSVTADASQIEEVIVTLALKARDAMPQGGRLTITTENLFFDAPYTHDEVQVPAGGYVRLAVSDTGTGMNEDERERIFEPFASTTTTAPGLELAAVYGFVKQSGGYIWVSSQPGHGTTFMICLPRAGGAAEDLAAAPKRP